MMDQTLELLSRKIEERRMEVLRSIGDGAAKDYAHYQNATGFLRGLMTVQAMIADIADRLENSDE